MMDPVERALAVRSFRMEMKAGGGGRTVVTRMGRYRKPDKLGKLTINPEMNLPTMPGATRRPAGDGDNIAYEQQMRSRGLRSRNPKVRAFYRQRIRDWPDPRNFF